MYTLLDKLKREDLAPKERFSIRKQVILNIKNMRDELTRMLREEKNLSFRIQLLEIIGDAQDDFFEDELLRIIHSEKSIEVLQVAVTMIGKLKGKRGFETLINLLDHENPNVRLSAIYGLRALNDRRAIKYLLRCLDDHESVRLVWTSPKAGGYTIAKEAAKSIDIIAGQDFRGDKEKIEKWIGLISI
jgi:HEAT repeat protein